MVEELVGYVSSNSKRKQVVDVLGKNGSCSIEAISKMTRISRLSLDRVMQELAEKNIVAKEKDTYSLTDIGQKVVMVAHSVK